MRNIGVQGWAAVLAATVALAGCGNDGGDGATAQETAPAAPTTTFVGKVDGSSAYIALVSDANRLLGYVCDSKRTSGWIAVAAIRDRTAILSTRGGNRLGQATFSADGVSGAVTVGGRRRTFSARRSSGDAGLYRAARVERRDGRLSAGEVELGWVVLPDGTQRGGTNIGTSDVPLVRSAPRLSPGTTNVSVNLAGSTIKVALTNIRAITPIPIP